MARGTGKYNKTYEPELWEYVNQENKDILDDFLMEYKQRKMSPRTIEGYYQDIRIILVHILKAHKNKSVLNLTKKDFRNISIWLSEGGDEDEPDGHGRSNSRVNRMKSALNSMLTFVEEDDSYDYEVNVAKKVKGLPKSRVKTNEDNFFFTFKEFIQMRDKLVEMGDLQGAVMTSLLYDSAARLNEIFQVTKHGLLDGNKTNVVVGKRGKRFALVYLNDTKELIRQYLEERGEDDIDSLWISNVGGEKRPINKNAIYARVLKCSKILSEIRGKETNIFTHSYRHSRLEALVNGEDDRLKDKDGNNRKYTLNEIMVLAHHSDVSTSQSYLKDHSEDVIDGMFGFAEKDEEE